jgi:hypothetical protein
MRILISNDDGIYSPGILALAEAAAQFGDVRIVAPMLSNLRWAPLSPATGHFESGKRPYKSSMLIGSTERLPTA